VIELAGVSPHWDVLPMRVLEDMHGVPISRRQLQLQRVHYTDTLNDAVAELLEALEEELPGVRVTVMGFQPVAGEEEASIGHDDAIDEFDFVIAPSSAPMRPSSSERRDDELSALFGETVVDWAVESRKPLAYQSADGSWWLAAPAYHQILTKPEAAWAKTDDAPSSIADDQPVRDKAGDDQPDQPAEPADHVGMENTPDDEQAPSGDDQDAGKSTKQSIIAVPVDESFDPREGSDFGGDVGPGDIFDMVPPEGNDVSSDPIEIPDTRFPTDEPLGETQGSNTDLVGLPGTDPESDVRTQAPDGFGHIPGGTSGGSADGGDDSVGQTPGSPDDDAPGVDPGAGPGDNSSFIDAPVLESGSGFSGVTAQPAPVGYVGTPGWNAQAIARWNVVPFQDVDDRFEVGVVAFHKAGIDRVEISLNNGPWTAIDKMTHNPRTDTHEYWAVIDPAQVAAAGYADGLFELRARVFPKAGIPRVLQGEVERNSLRDGVWSMFLNLNGNGTLARDVRYVSVNGSDSNDGLTPETAMRTMAKAGRELDRNMGTGHAGGGTIYLLEGEHRLGPARVDEHGNYIGNTTSGDRWLNVTAAPGTNKDNVLITDSGSGGLRVCLLRIHDLTVRQDVGVNGIFRTSQGANELHHLWLDGLRMHGMGRIAQEVQSWHGGFNIVFATDIHLTESPNGLIGAHVMFQRNVHLEQIGTQAFQAGSFIVNCRVDTLSRDGAPSHFDWHPDVWLLHAPNQTLENHIIFNLAAFDVNTHSFIIRTFDRAEDFALVNYFVESRDVNTGSQWSIRETDHLLMWHVSIINQPLWFRDDTRTATNPYTAEEMVYTNIDFVGCNFHRITFPINMDLSGLSGRDNHSVLPSVNLPGNPTVGDPLFMCPAEPGDWGAHNDYRPGPGSPLLNRIVESTAVTPVDLANAEVSFPAAIGSLQP
jgi:hypothetical protein